MFLGSLIGAIIGGFVAITQENSKIPNIEILPGKPADGNGSRRFLHLKITNIRRENFWQKFRKGNKPALLCKIQLEFLDPENKTQLFEIQARWSTSAEPLTLSSTNLNIGTFDPRQAFAAEVENILTSESKEIDIALKNNNEQGFYGFNNWSYLYNHENPDWHITSSSVLVRVNFSCDTTSTSKLFRISNPNTRITNFKIKEVKS